MEKGEICINTENIFPIIKKAVYSDHEIFLRELVSNGVDAISKGEWPLWQVIARIMRRLK